MQVVFEMRRKKQIIYKEWIFKSFINFIIVFLDTMTLHKK